MSELYHCLDTVFVSRTEPQVYVAKKCRNNTESYTFHEANKRPDSEEYIKGIKFEIMTLEIQRTWVSVSDTPDLNVIQGLGI